MIRPLRANLRLLILIVRVPVAVAKVLASKFFAFPIRSTDNLRSFVYYEKKLEGALPLYEKELEIPTTNLNA